MTIDSGPAGVVAAETVLSYSDGARGILWVRGHTLSELVAEVERPVDGAFARRKPGRPALQPNVEINAALLLDAVGLPRDAFTPVFAVARCAGWRAHAMEQRREGRLVRPSSAYVGPRPQSPAAEV